MPKRALSVGSIPKIRLAKNTLLRCMHLYNCISELMPTVQVTLFLLVAELQVHDMTSKTNQYLKKNEYKSWLYGRIFYRYQENCHLWLFSLPYMPLMNVIMFINMCCGVRQYVFMTDKAHRINPEVLIVVTRLKTNYLLRLCEYFWKICFTHSL